MRPSDESGFTDGSAGPPKLGGRLRPLLEGEDARSLRILLFHLSVDFGSDDLEAVRRQVEEEIEEQSRIRGCSSCPVRRTCSRCPFTGRISAEAFCELRRALGPKGIGSDHWRSLMDSAASGIAVGWND